MFPIKGAVTAPVNAAPERETPPRLAIAVAGVVPSKVQLAGIMPSALMVHVFPVGTLPATYLAPVIVPVKVGLAMGSPPKLDSAPVAVVAPVPPVEIEP